MSKSLSILLPTYNCICTALVGELQRQCVAEGADFEIIVADDASPNKRFIAENRAIAHLDGVRYIERERNVGRSAIRNYLVSQSAKEWMIFFHMTITYVKCKSKTLNKNTDNYMHLL